MNQLTHLLLMLRLERPGVTEVHMMTNHEGRWSVGYRENGTAVAASMWFNTPDGAIGHVEATLRQDATIRRTELEKKLKATIELLDHPPLVEKDE